MHAGPQQQAGQQRPPGPLGQELALLQPASPLQKQQTQAATDESPQQACAEAAEIFPQVAGPDVGKPLQRSTAGGSHAIEGGKTGNTAEAARQPAVEEGLLAVFGVSDLAHHSTPQQWSSEKGEAACHCCFLQLLVTTTPDPLTDQGGHAAHQGLRSDATSPNLGQRRSEKAASFIAFRRLVWITQITQGVPQLR